jgi:hypothetical protein
MTNTRADNPLVSTTDTLQHPPMSPPSRSRRERWSIVFQLVLSLSVALGVLGYLLMSGGPSRDDPVRPTRPEPVVRIISPLLIYVEPGTPLDKKLQVATVETAWLSAPVLPVTGMALASLRPGKEAAQDAWQFATPELLASFSDWQKAVKDSQFQETQLKAVRDLNQARIDAQKKVVARMEKLVAAGTDTEKDLAAERTNLIQFEIQARKDIHDSEQTVYLSHRTEATLARQLQQAGLEPTLLRSAAVEGDIIVAEVPERMMGRVSMGMTCQVRFFALPNRMLGGKVSGISPVISKDKRVLNVQFIVRDPEGLVRPGMFAEIGLGTDKRQALLIPADGVLHVGDNDYVLVAVKPATWQVTQVQTGELRGSQVEVLAGLKAGARVLGKGAILVKPVVSNALQSPVSAAAVAETEANGRSKDR